MIGDLRRYRHSTYELKLLRKRSRLGEVTWLCEVMTGPCRGDVVEYREDALYALRKKDDEDSPA